MVISLPSKQLSRAHLWLLAVALWMTAGCSVPLESNGLPSQPSPPTDTPAPADSDAGAAGSEEGESSGADKKKLEVRTLDLRTTQAREALERNYSGFLERQPLGFSNQLLSKFRTRAVEAVDTVRQFPTTLRQASPLQIVGYGLPIVIVATFIAGFFIVTRQIGRVAHRFQAELHLDISSWLTRLVRGIALIVAEAVAIGALVVLSYFPVQALFGTQPWTAYLTNTLWLLLAYAVLSSLVKVLFSGRVIRLDGSAGRQLERMLINGLRVIFTFLIILRGLILFGVDPAITAFVQFIYRLALVAFPLTLYFAKDPVVRLIPESTDSRLYRFFRAAVVRNYRFWMGITAILLAMRSAGYLKASQFILVRGYLAVALVVGLFVGFRAIRGYLTTRITREEEREPEAGFETTGEDRRTLSRRIEQMVGLGLIALGLSAALRLFWLLEPTLILLRTPFLAIGGTQISLFSFVSLGVIILGTILATTFIRALLNAKIYPLLEVDVGVAYAINTILKYVLIVVAFLLALTSIGVDLTAITVVIASLGIGIGFGLQTLVENLISGFILLFGRSVEKGDFITVEDTYGQVEAVGARSVIIRTPDNFEMLVPSKEIVGNRIINWSYNDDVVRACLPVGVSYDAEPEEVREVLVETTERHPDVLEEPPPSVLLREFGDSSVNFELLFFFNCRATTEQKVIGELNYEVWEALEAAGITIPFPQRDLHVKSGQAPQTSRSEPGPRDGPFPPADYSGSDDES
jgi:small-conductance mechanosensitive channel